MPTTARNPHAADRPRRAVRGRHRTSSTAIEMQVYKDRFGRCGRSPRSPRRRGDDQTFIVYGDARIGFTDVRPSWPTRCRTRCADSSASGTATGSRCCRPTTPSGASRFWGTVDLGAILVGLNGWWKTDEILYGLAGLRRKVLVADAERFERIADDIDASCPDLEAVFLDRRRPRRLRSASHGSTASTSCRRTDGRPCPTSRSTRTTPPSSSTRAARPGDPRARSRPTAT